MPDIRKYFHESFPYLSYKNGIGADQEEFLAEITYSNWVRLRIISILALIIFAFLLILDIFHMSSGEGYVSVGYSIIATVHVSLILFLLALRYLFYKKSPESPSDIIGIHKISSNVIVFIGVFCYVLLSLGDMLAFGSMAAYLGMMFASGSIIILTNAFSIFLYASNTVFMVIALIAIKFIFGISTENQILNTVTFSFVAWFMSRVIYYYSLKDFINRHLISNQNREIREQNEKNEELIVELKSALSEVKALQGFLPICARCKKIRDDKGYWQQLEIYIQDRSDAEFTHGICPECIKNMYPDIADKVLRKHDK